MIAHLNKDRAVSALETLPVISLSIPGVPKPKQRARFSRHKGHVRTYDAQSEDNNTMRWQLKARMQSPPLTGPLSVDLKFFMPIPKSTSKRNREMMLSGDIKHTKTPDCDNLCKRPFDCMNGIVFLDDKQIYKLTATKLYGETPRTEIEVWQELSPGSGSESGRPKTQKL